MIRHSIAAVSSGIRIAMASLSPPLRGDGVDVSGLGAGGRAPVGAQTRSRVSVVASAEPGCGVPVSGNRPKLGEAALVRREIRHGGGRGANLAFVRGTLAALLAKNAAACLASGVVFGGSGGGRGVHAVVDAPVRVDRTRKRQGSARPLAGAGLTSVTRPAC